MASQRFISNIKAEIRGAADRAGAHATLHDNILAGKAFLMEGEDPATEAAGHMRVWERYETDLANLGRFLTLAESGASDNAVKAAGYDPESYRALR